jgi:uncharacterized protein (TIGR00266 family)
MMETEIRNRPSFAHVVVHMNPGDRVVAESDAMASMTPGVRMRARMAGGFFTALVRRMFGGESFFVNEFDTERGGDLVLTNPTPGDVMCVDVTHRRLFLEAGAFLACEPGVELGVGFAGFTSMFTGEGLFRLWAAGQGRLWFGAYGGIIERDITDELVVDSGHLVAYEDSLSLSLGLAGGVFSSLFSGEGVVARLRGRGKVYLQSRSLDALASWTNGNIF